MDETAADPTNVRAGSGSEGEEVGEEAAGTEGRAPQGYQHGSGAGGWSTAQVQQLMESTVMSILNGIGKGNGKGLGKNNESEEASNVLLEERFFRSMEKIEDSIEGGAAGYSTLILRSGESAARLHSLWNGC